MTDDAREAIPGLVAHGPVAVVNAERARLNKFITSAGKQVERIEGARRDRIEFLPHRRRLSV